VRQTRRIVSRRPELFEKPTIDWVTPAVRHVLHRDRKQKCDMTCFFVFYCLPLRIGSVVRSIGVARGIVQHANIRPG